MKSFIRNLSTPTEFFLVILICFGLSIFASLREAVGHLLHGPKPYSFGNGIALWLVVYESLAFALVFWIGRIRGWSLATFGLRISWKWTGAGILLVIAVLVALIFQTLLLNAILPPTGHANPLTGTLTLPFVILVSLINPVFEELMEVGYFVHTLKQYGMWPSVLASAFFRAFLHAYTGFNMVVSILLLGLIFGLAYWRWRQLWPLMVAHAIFDFFALHRLVHAT
jgi:uncharacterized protein